jgi:fumarate reductase subunit C
MNKKQLLVDFTWGPIIVCASLLASYLRDLGYTDSDTVTRVVMCLSGLMIASFGNRVPESLIAQSQTSIARKMESKSLVLGGLTFTGLWAFAEISVANPLGIAILVLSLAITLWHVITIYRSASKTN